MEFLPCQLKARLDRCRQQRQRVVTCQEQEGWWAEEAASLTPFSAEIRRTSHQLFIPHSSNAINLVSMRGKPSCVSFCVAPEAMNITEGLGQVPPTTGPGGPPSRQAPPPFLWRREDDQRKRPPGAWPVARCNGRADLPVHALWPAGVGTGPYVLIRNGCVRAIVSDGATR